MFSGSTLVKTGLSPMEGSLETGVRAAQSAVKVTDVGEVAGDKLQNEKMKTTSVNKKKKILKSGSPVRGVRPQKPALKTGKVGKLADPNRSEQARKVKRLVKKEKIQEAAAAEEESEPWRAWAERSACVSAVTEEKAAAVLANVETAVGADCTYALRIAQHPCLLPPLPCAQIFASNDAGLQALLKLKWVFTHPLRHFILSPAQHLKAFTVVLCFPCANQSKLSRMKVSIVHALASRGIRNVRFLQLNRSTFLLVLEDKAHAPIVPSALNTMLVLGSHQLAYRWGTHPYCCRIVHLPRRTEETHLHKLLHGVPTVAVVPALKYREAIVYLPSEDAQKLLLAQHQSMVKDKRVVIKVDNFGLSPSAEEELRK